MQKPFELTLVLDRQPLAVCRIPALDAVPAWARGDDFISITRTSSELSIVCGESLVPEDVVASRGWVRLEIVGPLDFSLVGIMAHLSGALAAAGLSVFVISTYDTDHILVRSEHADAAVKALKTAGCVVDSAA